MCFFRPARHRLETLQSTLTGPLSRRQLWILSGGAARPQDLVGFPPSPAGQLAYVHALRATLREALPAAQNGGFLWWEETEGADDSLFDAHYVARPALRHGFATPSRRHGKN